MEPIISPWFFYLLYIVDSIDDFFVVSVFVFVVALILWAMGTAAALDLDVVDDETAKNEFVSRLAKKVKKLFVYLIVALVFSFLMPDKETIIQMYIASKATPDNIEKVINKIDKVKDELIEDFIKLKNGQLPDSNQNKQNKKEE